MTPKELFVKAYRRTLAATGAKADAAHTEECWRQVAGFAASLYDEAATTLNASCRFLPKPAEWREALEAVQAAREAADREARSQEWEAENARSATYHCATCQDTGFAPHACQAGDYCTSCSHGAHLYDHPYRTRCPCWRTNPELARRRETQVRQVTAREARTIKAKLEKASREWQKVTSA